MKDWIKLSGGEQHFIKMVLAFFAARCLRAVFRRPRVCAIVGASRLRSRRTRLMARAVSLRSDGICP